ncbi:URC4/urg3 family protein [Methylobrevis albus]|uniref:URC4/urg3 family protein n=1 Tax=Methylobrevis albus TaxID=2793297 RepID=A0A931I3H0_9HYPH|nr:URC4/urg3 family protein [Methylobrevis albus]MBH0238580.1 URC4/urg3 family protein [Methylobrevis albus]
MTPADLLSAAAVRARAHAMLGLGLDGRLDHFTVDLSRLDAAADYVIAVMRANYSDLDVPFHARWRHFEAGGLDRWAFISDVRDFADPAEAARAAFDLAIVSVLLDAGAGPKWSYADVITGEVFTRSEGLAVASVAMFVSGLFSADPGDPFRADARALAALSAEELATGFQADAANPLVALEGRANLLNRLGQVVAGAPEVFGIVDTPRPGGLYDALAAKAVAGQLPAPVILETVLAGLGGIWPGRIRVGGVDLGDCWQHPALVTADETSGLVPFHKLSQWLSYSLIEPLEAAGIRVTDVDGLTGLAEYRNGGLFVDLGVIALRDPAEAEVAHAVDSALVVEWRALTVALLDRIADAIREKLGLDRVSLPLAKVLEGGTWAAGRQIARETREGGGPPILVVSDGTVF